MKPILPLFAIAALSAGISLLPRASAESALGAPALDDESELDQRMLIIKAQVRTLRRSLRDAEKNPDSLAALHALLARQHGAPPVALILKLVMILLITSNFIYYI